MTVTPGRRTIPLLALGAALVLGAWFPGPTRAALPGVSAIPDEHGSQLLDGEAVAAVVADITGDGTRDLVRVVRRTQNPGQLAVDAWTIDTGRPTALGQVSLMRGTTPEEKRGSPRPADGMLPVRVGEPARFLVWHDHGRERLLLATIGMRRDQRACCLTVWLVQAAGGTVQLSRMIDSGVDATSIVALDLDADGTDELLVSRAPSSARPNDTPIVLYRWDGARFGVQQVWVRGVSNVSVPVLSVLGNTDGIPGDEAALVIRWQVTGVSDATQLVRLAWRAGALGVEQMSVPFDSEVTSVAVLGGQGVVVSSFVDGFVWRWPAGGSPERIGAISAGANLLVGTLGGSSSGGGSGGGSRSGKGTVLQVASDTGTRRLLLIDPLGGGPVNDYSPSAGAASFEAGELAPYVGPLPGGLPISHAPAFIFSGRLLTDGGTPRPVAALPAMMPVGVLGIADGWVALIRGAGWDIGRRGGPLLQGAPPAVTTLAHTEELLTPEQAGGAMAPQLRGAVAAPGGVAGSILTRNGFVVRIGAPPGSAGYVVPLGPQYPIRVVRTAIFGSSEFQLAVDPPPPDAGNTSDTGDAASQLRTFLVTPAGHGYATTWRVRVLDKPPALSAQAPFAPLSFSVPIDGRASAGASVIVDGSPVTVRADGTWVASVGATLLPREVSIVAHDQLGNVASTHVSVVALLDYRQLPWVPITVVLTVVTALVLYLRAPRSAARPAPADGPLEEIEEL